MSRYSSTYKGVQENTSEQNVYWYENSQAYRVEITRKRNKFRRSFYVVDYGSKERAFEVACACKKEFASKYPERRNCNPNAGNDAWRALSNSPRKRPTSQLLEWIQQSK